jgi:hypothetical protein
MSKFSIPARIAELRQVNTSLVSRAVSPEDVEETLLQHFFKTWRSQRAAKIKKAPNGRINPQDINEKSDEPSTHPASLYDLASANPHVIAATLFLRKR